MKFVPLLLAAALTLTNAMAQGPLRIEGSNTFGEKLGPLLVTAFEGKNPGIRVALKRPGSGPGPCGCGTPARSVGLQDQTARGPMGPYASRRQQQQCIRKTASKFLLCRR
jgi:hypothetical protein